jgi:hypothetical protein
LWRQAAIVGAIAWNESGVTPRIARAESLPYDIGCYPYRALLRLEDGRDQLEPSWRNDSDIMSMLESQGWLNGQAPSRELLVLDSAENPNDELAYVFEWLIDRRKAAALTSFSVGMTQCYLIYAGINPRMSTPIPGRADTMDSLFRFYTARTAKEAFDTGMFGIEGGRAGRYLRTDVGFYPRPGFSSVCTGNISGCQYWSDTCVQKYLCYYQVGNVPAWGDTWDGNVWRNYSTRFMSAVNTTWTLGAELDYPNRA